MNPFGLFNGVGADFLQHGKDALHPLYGFFPLQPCLAEDALAFQTGVGEERFGFPGRILAENGRLRCFRQRRLFRSLQFLRNGFCFSRMFSRLGKLFGEEVELLILLPCRCGLCVRCFFRGGHCLVFRNERSFPRLCGPQLFPQGQDFLAARKLESLQELERSAQAPVQEKPAQKKESAQAFQAQKFISKEQRKIQNRVSFLEKEIAKREKRMGEIEAILAKGVKPDMFTVFKKKTDSGSVVEMRTSGNGFYEMTISNP